MTALHGGRVQSRSLEAWRHSHLAELPDDAREAMLGDAFVVTISAGNPIGEPGDCKTLALVHSGLTRIVLSASYGDGPVRRRRPGPRACLGADGRLALDGLRDYRL